MKCGVSVSRGEALVYNSKMCSNRIMIMSVKASRSFRNICMVGLLCGFQMGFSACTAEGSFDDEGIEVDELTEELSSVERAWRSGTFDGDLGIRLSWEGSADLDVYVKNPRGEVIYYGRRSDSRGGVLTKNTCTASQCSGQTSEEVGWLDPAHVGQYEVWVKRDNTKAVSNIRLEVSRAGAIEQTFEIADLGDQRGDSSSSVTFDVDELPVESTFTGELGLQLSWSGSADLDLYVTSSSGERIYYGNRTDSMGGKLTKNECLLSRCDHRFSEEVTWKDVSPRGAFTVEVVNYNGSSASNVKLRMHSRGQILETFDVTVPSTRRGRVDVSGVSFDSSPLNPDGISFVSHSDKEWVRGEDVVFELGVSDAAIARVELSVNGRKVGSAATSGALKFEHSFGLLGEQHVDAVGYDGDGKVVALKKIRLVATDMSDGLPRRGTGARDVSRELLAARIHSLPGIELFTQLFDSRYRRDESNGVYADANNNMLDASNGNRSFTSCYGNGPCTRTMLDEDMLQAILLINQKHGLDFRISTITGGSHSSRSRHYSGIAFDVNRINGSRLSTSTRSLNRQVTDLCRAYGATEVLSPPDAGHSSHIHCAWPR